jgi:hypothetical protein
MSRIIDKLFPFCPDRFKDLEDILYQDFFAVNASDTRGPASCRDFILLFF